MPVRLKSILRKWPIFLWTMLIILLALAYWLFWPAGPIIPGPDTTLLTHPLNPDGTVNYVAALNKELSKGVTTENNAAIPLLKALGPGILWMNTEGESREVLAALGLGSMPTEGDYFVLLGDYATLRPTATSVPATFHPYSALHYAMVHPWIAEDSPLLFAWLHQNEKPLALVRQASELTHLFFPIVPRPGEFFWRDSQHNLNRASEVSSALAARAMLCAGRGEIDLAWDDIIAVYRLAGLLGTGPRGTQNVITGFGFELLAAETARHLFTTVRLTETQARRILAEIERLSPVPDIALSFNTYNRYFLLDVTGRLSTGGFPRLAFEGSRFPNARYPFAINWNEILRFGNGWYDRIVESHRRSTFAQRKAALKSCSDDFRRGVEHPPLVSMAALGKLSPTGALKYGLLLISMVSIEAGSELQCRVAMNRRVVRVALALEAFRAQNGEYPEALVGLRSAYLKDIPEDLFINRPMKYRRAGSGCVLYSVGPNMVDDGGKGRLEGSLWDDIVVRCTGL